ncbi:2573_t:CDS:2 [Cetraspora pellucida]|uniref:2573_t:CDS:1 n=1 Tax=Cetraspora pellucida TaxID=1433469 RepID=A0ACA9MVJ5_9GLOM|nr:2573_t:CDS:2 [Cetraspora pellucida]
MLLALNAHDSLPCFIYPILLVALKTVLRHLLRVAIVALFVDPGLVAVHDPSEGSDYPTGSHY